MPDPEQRINGQYNLSFTAHEAEGSPNFGTSSAFGLECSVSVKMNNLKRAQFDAFNAKGFADANATAALIAQTFGIETP